MGGPPPDSGSDVCAALLMPAGWPVAAIPSREAFLGLHADRADISMDKAGGCGEAACVMTSGAAPRAMGLGQGFGSAACVRRDGAGRLAEAAGATAARTARCRLGKSHNLAALYARDGVRHRAHAAGGGICMPAGEGGTGHSGKVWDCHGVASGPGPVSSEVMQAAEGNADHANPV